MGVVLFCLEKYGEVRVVYEVVIKFNFKNFEVYVVMGLVLFKERFFFEVLVYLWEVEKLFFRNVEI